MSPLPTLSVRTKVHLVIGFWASLNLTIWALKEIW